MDTLKDVHPKAIYCQNKVAGDTGGYQRLKMATEEIKKHMKKHIKEEQLKMAPEEIKTHKKGIPI
jgi:queuine/archaeosine tRNA-ribosyltransferase